MDFYFRLYEADEIRLKSIKKTREGAVRVAKEKTRYVCEDCGHVSVAWLGKCPNCGAWNSFEEEVLTKPQVSLGKVESALPVKDPLPIHKVDGEEGRRFSSSFSEVDRVLGGGYMPGSLILLSGDPGIGKSTLTLQLAAHAPGTALYISGEESRGQIQSRARRLGVQDRDIQLATEANIYAIDSMIQKTRPQLLILDSVQTLFDPDVAAQPGAVSQLRAVTAQAMTWAKGQGVTTILVGHVTKDGSVAGPKVLEHMVDTVLFLEGDRFGQYRLLRALKNRFGSTQEIGIFDMTDKGMMEVGNPSLAFLDERLESVAGSAICCTMEGSRPILLEIQALVVKTPFNNPRRMTTGVDTNRVAMLLAVLEKRLGLSLSDQDVYINVVGGMRIKEPAADLAIALAVASAGQDRALPPGLIAIGEIGLSGELRRVPLLNHRLKEAANLGFSRALISDMPDAKGPPEMQVQKLRRLQDAFDVLWRPSS